MGLHVSKSTMRNDLGTQQRTPLFVGSLIMQGRDTCNAAPGVGVCWNGKRKVLGVDLSSWNGNGGQLSLLVFTTIECSDAVKSPALN